MQKQAEALIATNEALKAVYRLEGAIDQKEEQNQNTQNENSFLVISLNNENEGDIMRNITKRKDGRYMARVQIDGERKAVYGRTQKEIIVKLNKLRKNFQNIKTQKNNYTLKNWIEYWLKTYKEQFIKYTQYIELTQIMNEFSKPIENLLLTKITTNIIQEIYNKYARSRKKEKIILYVNACFQKAFDLGFIKSNPCKGVIKDKKIIKIKEPFSVEEQEKILQAIKGHKIEPYIYLFLLTGIRKGEIPDKIENNLDMANFRLKVFNEKQRDESTSIKWIDLSENYAKTLYEQAKQNCFNMKTDTVYRQFKRILQTLEIKGDIHTLRHTFATNYYYLGVPEKLIQSWCGHKTQSITHDVYIGVIRKNIQEKLQQLYGDFLFKF